MIDKEPVQRASIQYSLLSTIAMFVVAINGCSKGGAEVSPNAESTSSSITSPGEAAPTEEAFASSPTISDSAASGGSKSPKNLDLSGVDLTVEQGPTPDLNDASTSKMEWDQLSPLMPTAIGKFKRTELNSSSGATAGTYQGPSGQIYLTVQDHFLRSKPIRQVAEFAESETSEENFNNFVSRVSFRVPTNDLMVNEQSVEAKERASYTEPDQRALEIYNPRFAIEIRSYSNSGEVGGLLSRDQLLAIVSESYLGRLLQLPTEQWRLGKISEFTTSDELLPMEDVERICKLEDMRFQDQPIPQQTRLVRFYQSKGRSPLMLSADSTGDFIAMMENSQMPSGRFERLTDIGDKCFIATFKYSENAPDSHRLVFTRGPYLIELLSTGERYTDKYVATWTELIELAQVADANLKQALETAGNAGSGK